MACLFAGGRNQENIKEGPLSEGSTLYFITSFILRNSHDRQSAYTIAPVLFPSIVVNVCGLALNEFHCGAEVKASKAQYPHILVHQSN